MQIDISFENWKKLTMLLQNEEDTLDQAVGRLLSAQGAPQLGCLGTPEAQSGLVFEEVFLPNGTQFRKTFKGKTYFATVQNGRWIDVESGEERTSPSQAAFAITGHGTNGWLFWSVKTPEMKDWISLHTLRKKS